MDCLTSKYTENKNAWGCLSEDNLLFRISSLSYIKIPDWVVEHLIRENKIWLKKDGMSKGYYECARPILTRTRLSFEDKSNDNSEEVVQPVEQTVNHRDSIMGLLKKPSGTKEVPKQRRISF